MDTPWVVLLGVICALSGVLVGWLLGAARVNERAATERARLGALLAGAEATADAAVAQLQEQRLLTITRDARDREAQAERDERDRREQTVLRALAPVQETLSSLHTTVETLERDRQHQFGSLAEQLRQAQRTEEALRATTESLAGALRSNTVRGVWGEIQLKRVVESAGLTRYVDFDTQSSITSDAGAGRPDMIVRLPGNKSLAVDAKAPLDAFLEAHAIAETAQGDEAARRTQLMNKHVKAVRAHVDALSKKAYWDGLETSPEFVICFLPSESLLAVALEHDPALLDYAFSKRVALASPVNLWSVLKTVAYTWTQQDVSAEARRLFSLGNELYGRLSVLAGHTEELRRSIERTVDSYNKLAGSLEGRVLVTARKFPGIDDTKLDALVEPAPITRATRRLTSEELMPEDAPEPLHADLGAIRERLGEN